MLGEDQATHQRIFCSIDDSQRALRR